jgi:hypothetical protein
MPCNAVFDSHGGMAKNTKDLADIITVLMGGTDYSSSLRRSWEGLSVGFVDPEPWQIPDFVTEANKGFKNQMVSTSFQFFDRRTVNLRLIVPRN